MTIGEKIKTRRQALGVTQKTLAGTKMTRNMVSEIESGKTQPSLSNLLYLAEKLNVSPAYLADENMTLYDDKKLRYESTLHALFSKGKYAECISYADKHLEGLYDNSIAYLLAHACLKDAEACAEIGSVNKAIALLDRMEAFISETTLDTAHLTARALLCRALTKEPLAPQHALDDEAYQASVLQVSNEEFYRYLKADLDYSYLSTIYASHIEAKRMMRENRYTEAITVINRLLERRLTEQISVLIIYRLYSDLETCYRERRDYENAYKCAGKKLSLLSSFIG